MYSANKQSQAAKDASKAQQEGSEAGIASQERMFDRSLELQQPYREAGYNALSGIQGLMTPEGRAQSLSSYYSSPEFSAMRQQQEEQTMRNAAMTGGVRSGGNQVALASIAPQLGQSFLSNLYNQYTGVANMGMGAASQGASSANYLGSSMNRAYQDMGEARGQNSLAQANITSNTMGTLGGMAFDYFGKG
jgi:hypothetical protein